MITMKHLSRVSSPSYKPLASSPTVASSSYDDLDPDEADPRDAQLLPSSRYLPPPSKRGTSQSSRRSLLILLGVAIVLSAGLSWSSGVADVWAKGTKGDLAKSVLVDAAEATHGGASKPETENLLRPIPIWSDTEPSSSAEGIAEPVTSSDDEEDDDEDFEPSSGYPHDDPPNEIAGSSTKQNSAEENLAAVPPPIPILNVRPHPRPPPSDPQVAEEMRYMSFENHSGFHNQRKSLVNALLIAHILNRTLLLPPARLGSPAPWEPVLDEDVPRMERCKAGLTLPTDARCSAATHSDGNLWTYVGWSYLVSEKLLEGRQLVDRWNSSMDWMYESVERGGLGIQEDDIVRFEDPIRRSYQFYDDREASTHLGAFALRVDLEDLMDLREAKLLHFGSMFGSGRTMITRRRNLEEMDKLEHSMILDIEKIEGISDAIRDALGSYVGVHLRVGDGIFKDKAKENMRLVFRRLCKTVFKLKRRQIDALLADSASRPPPVSVPHQHRHGRLSSRAITWSISDDIEDPSEHETSVFPSSHHRRAVKTARPHARPMSPNLHCRSALHKDPALRALNMPLYIATDSHHPLSDRNLAPFFHHFPCAFLISDFAHTEGGLHSEPIPDLVEMVEGKWTSDWDGQGLAHYLYPFLEAEVAAKAIAVVGTPQSTFSGYTSGILHNAYLEQGRTTEQVSARKSSTRTGRQRPQPRV